MKELSHHQAHIIWTIEELAKSGHELTAAGANISFKPHAMKALLKKGLVREVRRERQAHGTTWNYTAYELV